MPPKGLSDSTKQAICMLFKQGDSYKGIARKLLVTKGQVAGVLWRAGLCQKRERNADNARENAAGAGGSQSS